MFKAQNIYTFFIENILVEFILSQNFSLIFMLWFSATLIPHRSRRIMIQVDPIFCDDLVTQAHWLGCHGMDELLEELRLYKRKPRAMTNNCFSFSNLDDPSVCLFLYIYTFFFLGSSGKLGNLCPNSSSKPSKSRASCHLVLLHVNPTGQPSMFTSIN